MVSVERAARVLETNRILARVVYPGENPVPYEPVGLRVAGILHIPARMDRVPEEALIGARTVKRVNAVIDKYNPIRAPEPLRR